MRILHIGKYFEPFVGGIETVTKDLALSAAAKGHKVTVLCHDHDTLRASKKWRVQRVCVQRVSTLMKLVFTPVSLVFPLALRRALKENPDIVHVHLPNPSAIWLLVFRRGGSKVIIHWHADVLDSSATFLLRIMYYFYQVFERKLLKSSAEIICTSPQYAYFSKPLIPWLDKVTIVPLGVNVEALTSWGNSIEHSPFAEQTLKVLTVARLSFFKGHRYLAAAIASLVKKGIRIEWTIVGEGEQQADLLRLIRNLGLTKHVHFLGTQTGRELVRSFQHCDVFCLPSVNRMESFGIVLLEAMCFAKPCIVTDAPGSGMSHVIQDGYNGRVVARADAEALAEALECAASNPDKWQEMGDNAAVRVRQNFTNTVVAEQILSLYDRLIESNKSSYENRSHHSRL